MISSFAQGTSLRLRLARATLWMVIGSGLNQAFAMLASITTARMLGRTAFGEFGAVRSTTLTLAVLAGGGLGIATTRYVAALRVSDPERAGRLIRLVMSLAWSMTFVAAIGCVALARPIAAGVMRSEQLGVPLMVSGIAIVFLTVAGVQIGVIAGCEAFRAVGILLALEGFTAGALMVAGARLGGVTGAIAGFAAGSVLSFLIRRHQVGRECARVGIPLGPPSFRGARSEMKFLLSAVLPSTLLVLGAQPAEWLARMMLVRAPNGMASLGIFTAAYSWAQLVQFVPSQITSPALTILSNLFGAGELRRFRRVLAGSTAMIVGIASLIAIPLALLAPFVMGFYGPAFRDGAQVFSVIVCAYVGSSALMILRATFLAAGRIWLQLGFTIAWGILLPLSFFLQPDRTGLGLAFSYAVSFLIVLVAQAATAWFLFRHPVAITEPPIIAQELK